MAITSGREDSENNKDIQPVPRFFVFFPAINLLFFSPMFSVYSPSEVRATIFISCFYCN